MPGDLSNPEFSIPYHYDSKYDPGTNTFESRPISIEQIIQSIARSERGHPLTKEQLVETQSFLKGEKLNFRNPGDQEVQEALHKHLKVAARKVVQKWLISIDN
ncbi:MAG: hypothetical protein IMZ64_08080 [Bacteroidetes bacterium]|nr:hypothetical protein [Bacteroidota bacterium]